MKITRERALTILKYLEKNESFYFPFKIVCNDFNENDEYYDYDCIDISYSELEHNTSLVDFSLEENLQNLNSDTIELMAKGFLDKIENTDAYNIILNNAIEYRKSWKEDLWESEDSEEFGLNEFIGGNAEAYEDCVEIIKEHMLYTQNNKRS